jgi:hypothetical protein
LVVQTLLSAARRCLGMLGARGRWGGVKSRFFFPSVYMSKEDIKDFFAVDDTRLDELLLTVEQ